MVKTTTRTVCFIILVLNLCNQINSQCERNQCMCCSSGTIDFYNAGILKTQACQPYNCLCCVNNKWEWRDRTLIEVSTTNSQQQASQQNTNLKTRLNPTNNIVETQTNLNSNINNQNGNRNQVQDFTFRGASNNQRVLSNADVHLPTIESKSNGAIVHQFIPSFESNYNKQDRNQPNRNIRPSYNRESLSNDDILNNNENQAINSITDFSLNLLKKISTDKNQNLVISPISVQFLLLLLEKGAAGPTKTELKAKIGGTSGEVLRNILRKNVDGLKTALGIFHDQNIEINTGYKQKIAGLAEIESYDFINSPQNTKERINNWASRNTEGKITDLIPQNYDLQSVTVVLLSAIYFHNTWKYKFEPINNQKFQLGNGEFRDIPFMEFTQNIPFYEISEYNCTVINLPYKDEKFSMVLIVPSKQNSGASSYHTQTNSLDQFIENFDSRKLYEILSTTKEKFERFIKLQIPKFSVKSELSLVEPLKQNEIRKIFGSDSNLSGISTSNAFVSDILQQATLDVDENGTIAAAATSALLIPLSAGSKPRPITFTLDRPFISIILDQENKTPLFISKINNPVL